jgi:exonuclease III
MKVATWNVDQQYRFDAAFAERQRKHIDVICADVWVFTEAHLQFTLGSGYKCIANSAVAQDITSAGGRWVSIWSRLSASVVKLTADLERSAAIRLNDTGVVIVGTVLPWRTDARQHPKTGSAAFQARLAEQAADWKRLRDEYGGRVCLAGDFNQDLRTTGHYNGSADGKQALREALAACELVCLTGDDADPLNRVPDRASIDHICIGKGLHLKTPPDVWVEPKAATVKPDDHYGVWAEIEIAPTD